MAKYVVNHPNFFLAVDGKLQQMEKDSVIEADEKHVARHLANDNLKAVSEKAPTKVGDEKKQAAKAK